MEDFSMWLVEAGRETEQFMQEWATLDRSTVLARSTAMALKKITPRIDLTRGAIQGN